MVKAQPTGCEVNSPYCGHVVATACAGFKSQPNHLVSIN